MNIADLRASRRAVLGAGGLTAAAGAALAVLLLGGALPGDSAPAPDRLDQVGAPSADTRPLSVGLSTFNTGPLDISVGEPFPGADSWHEHAFVVRNTSEETVHLNDPRFSRFVGDRQLLLGLGCGHGLAGDVAVEGCFADYRPRSLAPGESLDLPMLLFRDLPGMKPLHSGRFPAHADIAYRSGAPRTEPGPWASAGSAGGAGPAVALLSPRTRARP